MRGENNENNQEYWLRMDWNPFGSSNFLDSGSDDFGNDQRDAFLSTSFHDLTKTQYLDDFAGLFSLYPTSISPRALPEDGNNPIDLSLMYGSSESTQFQDSQSVKAPSPEKKLFISSQASSLDNSSELSFKDTPSQQLLKPGRRALCDPCRCETLLLKLMPSFEEAGRLGPIENARRYAANLKKHLEDGNSLETLRQPINISRQNVWLVDNIFDANGGFLYCSQVIRKIFHLGSHRLSRLRLHIEINNPPKSSSSEDLSASQDLPSGSQRLTVEHILTNKLVQLVILPEEVKWRSDFKQVQAWLKTQVPSKLILVRRTLFAPPLQPRRLSNRALDDTKNLLVKMVQFGSIPTGMSIIRQGVKFYMDQGIRTICSPKQPTGGLKIRLFEKDRPTGNTNALKVFLRNLAAWGLYDKRLAGSLHDQFKVAFASLTNSPPVVSDTVRRWALEFLPEYALQPIPHPGVCEICEIYDFVMQGLVSREVRVAANGSHLVENIITGIQAARLKHLNCADAFVDCLETHFSRDDMLRQYVNPTQPTSSCEVEHLHAQFPFSMCAEYLPAINLPQFAVNSHPESAFESKSAVDTLACVAHNGSSLETVMILTCNEATGARSINHFLSSLNHYIQQYVDPSYLSFELYLDDVGSFKSWHVLAFLHHLVEIGRFKQTSLFYYPAGHFPSFSDRTFPQMPSSLHQDIFNIEELQRAWNKEVGISQAVVLDGREIVRWDVHLLSVYHPFLSMDEFATFQFENSDGQITFQVSALPVATQSASFISQPSIRNLGVPLPRFLTLQDTDGQSHYDDQKLDSIASLYKRFISDPTRWPHFVRRYFDHPQEHQEARPACSSTATLDRFISPLELHQSDDACGYLLSHISCDLTQQQQDDPDLVSRAYLRLFKHPDSLESLVEFSNTLLDHPSPPKQMFSMTPASTDTNHYLENSIFSPASFEMFLSGSFDDEATGPTVAAPHTSKRSLVEWEETDAPPTLRSRRD